MRNYEQEIETLRSAMVRLVELLASAQKANASASYPISIFSQPVLRELERFKADLESKPPVATAMESWLDLRGAAQAYIFAVQSYFGSHSRSASETIHVAAINLKREIDRPAPVVTEIKNPIDKMQDTVYGWGLRCFGQEHMNDPKRRGMRQGEEAIEFAQAVGVPKEKLIELVEHVYSREPGDPVQELGGIAVTWLAACTAMHIPAQWAASEEIARVLAKDPEHFRQRNEAKVKAGF